jgi:hypothetical protein
MILSDRQESEEGGMVSEKGRLRKFEAPLAADLRLRRCLREQKD